MKIDVLTGKITEFSSTVLVNKAKSWTTKFLIGAGTEAFVPKIEGFIRTTGAVNGDEVDIDALHKIVKAGFESAGHLDLMGGLIGFDASDVEELFGFIKK